MRKLLVLFLAIFTISAIFTSCSKEDTSFEKGLLIGKWKSGTVYYIYESPNTGKTWDTSDDVTEAEAQKFTWTLDKAELTHIYVTEIGSGAVPKVYTVTTLNATTLIYKDSFGKSYTFTKQ